MKRVTNVAQTVKRKWREERGAVIIQAALASIAVLAVTAFAVDYGLKLIARGEAQRAADAGALAGAISLAFDGAPDLTDAGPAKRNAQGFAAANTVFGQAPDVNISSDVTFIECPEPDGGPGTTCVQVDVYRNQERGNPLPALFSRIVGVANQGVRATATAKVLTSDKTDCLRPWAVIDRWDEFEGTEPDYPADDPDWCQGGVCGAPSTYDMYSTGQGNSPPQENDYYVAPAVDGSSPGTGFRAEGTPNDIGRQFALKVGSNESMTSGWGLALDLPRADTQSGGGGEGAYGPNIISCNGIDIGVNNPAEYTCPLDGKELTGYEEKVMWAERGCLRVQPGTMAGGAGSPTNSNVRDLVLLDSKAEWGKKQDGTMGVINSCCPSSPRIVPVAVVDIGHYGVQQSQGGGGVVRIANIFGFFIEGMGDFNEKTGGITISKNGTGTSVVGRLMKFSGSGTGSVNLHETASWSKIIVLVR